MNLGSLQTVIRPLEVGDVVVASREIALVSRVSPSGYATVLGFEDGELTATFVHTSQLERVEPNPLARDLVQAIQAVGDLADLGDLDAVVREKLIAQLIEVQIVRSFDGG